MILKIKTKRIFILLLLAFFIQNCASNKKDISTQNNAKTKTTSKRSFNKTKKNAELLDSEGNAAGGGGTIESLLDSDGNFDLNGYNLQFDQLNNVH